MSTALAVKEDKNLFTREQFDEPKNFTELLSACKILVDSKILPKEIDTPEKAAVVILTGRELGLRMMASCRGIYVVNGKPSLSSQMMLSLAYATGELEDIHFEEIGKGESASCTVTVKRKGKKQYSYSFSVDQAKKMQKYASEWLKQPENMCKQRAISGNLRVTFPDAILGMYTPEEIDTLDAVPAKSQIEMPRPLSSTKEVLEPPKLATNNESMPPKAAEAPKSQEKPFPAGYTAIKAVQDSRCKGCGNIIPKDSEFAFSAKKGSYHADCAVS